MQTLHACMRKLLSCMFASNVLLYLSNCYMLCILLLMQGWGPAAGSVWAGDLEVGTGLGKASPCSCGPRMTGNGCAGVPCERPM